MQKDKIFGLERKANHIRNLILDMCVQAKTGHVTSSFSAVEILVALYHGKLLRYDVANPDWEDRDRFILSKGQASPLLYSVLADIGYFPDKALGKFCQVDAMFGVHLQHDVRGVEITAGSLGHGLGIATGIALAAKMDHKDYLVYTLLGTGNATRARYGSQLCLPVITGSTTWWLSLTGTGYA